MRPFGQTWLQLSFQIVPSQYRPSSLSRYSIQSLFQFILVITTLLAFFQVTTAQPQPAFFSDLFNADSIMGAGQRARHIPTSVPHGFSDQSSYVGLSSSGALTAVGDFNRDRFIDLVMLDSKTQRKIGISFWDHDAYSFQPSGSGIVLDNVTDPTNVEPLKKINAVYVGDFGNDGALDMILGDGIQGRLFFGDGNGNFNTTHPVVIPQLPLEAALLDANADFIPDIFVAFSNGTRGFWVYEPNKIPVDPNDPDDERRYQRQTGEMKFKKWDSGVSSACKVVDPVSISFVDLDGDCLADLVIPTTCGLEVWTNPGPSNRKFWDLKSARSSHSSDMRLLGKDVFHAEHGDLSVAFADFDGDGTLDIAVPNRNRQDLLIHLNRQRKRVTGQLCEGDADWKLERRVGLVSGLKLRQGKIGGLFGGSVTVPPALHIGDYDLDGMPDILIIDGGSSRPILFRNLGKWKGKDVNMPHFKRMDRKIERGLSRGNGGSITAMFFDIDESGRQDILVVRGGNETRLMWNNLHEGWDTLFFKGTLLSSLGYRLDPRPFSPVVGNTLKISYMARGSRHRVLRTCSQCPQSGLWQLRPCNCQFGLMNIANYIEELWAGGGSAKRGWVSLMPNSMAVIWAEGGNNTSSWLMEYFTQRRGSQMLRVTAFLLVALVALGGGILILQHKERIEDKEEDEKERARLFNFV